MLNVIFRILSVLGIVFLALLAILAVFLLLVLFFPLSYRIRGSKDEEGFRLSVKGRWLFGLLRLKYDYPQAGHMVVKALCFTLYDRRIPGNDSSETEQTPERKRKKRRRTKDNADSGRESGGTAVSGKPQTVGSEGRDAQSSLPAKEDRDSQESSADEEKMGKGGDFSEAVSETTDAAEDEDSVKDANTEEFLNAEEQADENGKILQKFKKIKYTICRIYDKIKKIWKNISYYTALVQEEETKQLFAYILFRFGKIFKNIRPRRIKADIVFGTGSPDTTGYVYGMYCMLASIAGTGFWVTPDFEQAVLKGEIDMSGHITLWVLGWNGLKLFLDKNLRRFLDKGKRKA